MSEAEIDALLRARDTEWTGNLPRLSLTQLEELVALLPPLSEKKKRLFKVYVARIFQQACKSEIYLRSRSNPQKLSTQVAEELGTISKATETLLAALDGASAATKDILDSLPNLTFAGGSRDQPTSDRGLRLALASFGIKATAAAEDAGVRVRHGPSEAGARLMVWGLLALYQDVNGETPKRTHRTGDLDPDDQGAEEGAFLRLVQALGWMVMQALGPNPEREVSLTYTKIVREELEIAHSPVAEWQRKLRLLGHMTR